MTRTWSCGASPPGSSPGSSTSSVGPGRGMSPSCASCPPICWPPGTRRASSRRSRTRTTASGEAHDVNVLDWFLVMLVLAYAVSGYWQGFIAGAFATGGLLLGGLLGIWLAPKLLGDAAPALWVSLAALFVVLICASFGQAILQYAGARIRSRITWQPARALDAVGGAALSMAAVLVVAWVLVVAVSSVQLAWAKRQA